MTTIPVVVPFLTNLQDDITATILASSELTKEDIIAHEPGCYCHQYLGVVIGGPATRYHWNHSPLGNLLLELPVVIPIIPPPRPPTLASHAREGGKRRVHSSQVREKHCAAWTHVASRSRYYISDSVLLPRGSAMSSIMTIITIIVIIIHQIKNKHQRKREIVT